MKTPLFDLLDSLSFKECLFVLGFTFLNTIAFCAAISTIISNTKEIKEIKELLKNQ